MTEAVATRLPAGQLLCPRCGTPHPQDSTWWRSRTDERTPICSACETMERIEQTTRFGVKPQMAWTFPPYRK